MFLGQLKSAKVVSHSYRSKVRDGSSVTAMSVISWSLVSLPAPSLSRLKYQRSSCQNGKTYHVGVPVKCLHPRQQLLVVPQTDQDLRVISHTLLENRKRTLRDLMLFHLFDLTLVHIRFVHVGELTCE
jgi:hypothetical protein